MTARSWRFSSEPTPGSRFRTHAEDLSVHPILELGVGSATFYEWRAKFGGMDVSMMSRMKALEEQDRRLKRMYPQEKLKAEIVAEALKKSGEAISQT